MSATVRTVLGMSSLAAARSTATGTLRSIPFEAGLHHLIHLGNSPATACRRHAALKDAR